MYRPSFEPCHPDCSACGGYHGLARMLQHKKIPYITGRDGWLWKMERRLDKFLGEGAGMAFYKRLETIEEGWGWRFYYIRDVVRAFPPPMRCSQCPRLVKWWRRDWDWGGCGMRYMRVDHRDYYAFVCSDKCYQRAVRNRRKINKEKRCLRKGQQLLTEIKRLCQNPADLRRAASPSPAKESAPAATSPG